MRGIGRLLAATLVGLALTGSPARAAGGAHVVDDADVETPGACHLESWITAYEDSGGLLSSNPACTSVRLPMLEIGGSVTHSWSGGVADTAIGPALKWRLREAERGLGIAILATAGWSLRNERLETGGLVVPLTFDLDPKTRVNVNAGWLWARTGDRNAAFAGAQVERRVVANLSVMGEIFARDRGPLGAQAGLRWNPAEWADLDFLAARGLGGQRGHAATLGLTIRRPVK